MNISSLLRKEAVFLDIEAADKNECIKLLADAMEKSGILRDKEAYIETVLKREESGTTGVGFGIAIPHGKSSGVGEAGLAFARLKSPVEWESLDEKPVFLVFLIAVPQESAGDQHLRILMNLSKKLIDDEFRKKLELAETVEAVFEIM